MKEAKELNTLCQRPCATSTKSSSSSSSFIIQKIVLNPTFYIQFIQPPLMADFSNHHPLHNNFIQQDDIVNVQHEHTPYLFNFNHFSSSSSSSSSSPYHHRTDTNSCSCCSSETESDCPDSTVYPDYLYGHVDEYDQLNYITDLFHSTEQTNHVGVNVSQSDYFVSNNNNNNNIEELGSGLRLASIESDTDSDIEDLLEVVDLDNDDDNDNHNIIQTTDLNLEHVWDCPSFDDMDGVDRIEEISVSSDGGEVNIGVLEWEILLAVNDLERDLEFVMDEGEGFLNTPEFDTLIGQFVETVRALRGSPPAAKAVVDSLPLVELKMGDAKEGCDEICAVCKDGILVGEKVMQLPCRHCYHGECIVPWLRIRNTCPVCRFELPTDDVEYERSKNRESFDELRVGYGLDLSS